MELIAIKIPFTEKNPLKKIIRQIKDQNIPIESGNVLVLTSKILSYQESRVIRWDKSEFVSLVKKEADKVLDQNGKYFLTVKDGIVVINAGIDISNLAKDKIALWPKNPARSAEKIRTIFKKEFGKDIAIIISDSVCLPLRKGVGAVAIAIAGLTGNKDPRGNRDLAVKDRYLLEPNMADQLAAAASVLMGQADQKIPAVIIKNAPIKLSKQAAKKLTADLKMKEKDCIFRKLYL